jgi:hypothetical protein
MAIRSAERILKPRRIAHSPVPISIISPRYFAESSSQMKRPSPVREFCTNRATNVPVRTATRERRWGAGPGVRRWKEGLLVEAPTVVMPWGCSGAEGYTMLTPTCN